MQSLSSHALEHLVIVGGGTAGWITAAVLAHSLKHLNVKISLVEAPDIPTIGVGEATIPSFVDLLTYLRIPLKDFIAQTDATFKLAIKFENWRNGDDAYWHPFGKIGNHIDGLPFYQHWLSHVNKQASYQFSDFSPSVHLAQQNRFYTPKPDEKSNLSASAFALHFDAGQVANYLKSYCLALGVNHIAAKVNKVHLTQAGHIDKLTLLGKAPLKGDFYFDCTGQAALLIGKSLRIGYQDWRAFLPVDRALAVHTKHQDDIPPYTRAIAKKAGWRWQIPLRSRTGNGAVFCSDFMDTNAATDELINDVGEKNCLNTPRLIHFKTGKRDKIWFKNCLSVGLSSGFLEPLESTSIHLIMKAVLNFVQNMPDKQMHQASIDEYNRRMNDEYINIRDFIIAHYCISQRSDSEFWRCWQHLELPQSLQEKLALFNSYGRLKHNPSDLFANDSWYAVLAGMGQTPSAPDPLVWRSNQSMIERALADSYRALQQSASEKLSHSEYLRRLLKNP